MELFREDLVDDPVLAWSDSQLGRRPEDNREGVIHQYAMMGFTVWSCAALVAHFQMVMSACRSAAGMESAMTERRSHGAG